MTTTLKWTRNDSGAYCTGVYDTGTTSDGQWARIEKVDKFDKQELGAPAWAKWQAVGYGHQVTSFGKFYFETLREAKVYVSRFIL